jgi:hypothetical protein
VSHSHLPRYLDTYGGLLVHVTLWHPIVMRFTQPIPRAAFQETSTVDSPMFEACGHLWFLRLGTHVVQPEGRRRDNRLQDCGHVSLHAVVDGPVGSGDRCAFRRVSPRRGWRCARVCPWSVCVGTDVVVRPSALARPSACVC